MKESNAENLTYTNWAVNAPYDDFDKRGKQHCTVMSMVLYLKYFIVCEMILK